MSTTFLSLQNQVYEELRESPSTKESNRVYPVSLVKQALNDAQKRTLNRRNYSFLIVTKVFNCNADTILDEEVLVGATTIDVVDASVLKTSGKIVINENIITYTGVTSNTLTGVTGVTSIHEKSSTVKQVYTLAGLGITDLAKPISLVIDEEEADYYDYRGVGEKDGYTIYDGNLYLPEISESLPVIFKYKIQVPLLVEDTDEFIMPDDYVTLCKEYALYKCHRNVDDDRFQIAFAEYKRLVGELEFDYGKQTERKKTRIKSIYE